MDDKRTQGLISDEDRTALHLLQHFCYTIGSANDAEDHGYGGEAGRMREEFCESIRNLADQRPLLTEFFPELHWELESGHIFNFGWSTITREVDAEASDKRRRSVPRAVRRLFESFRERVRVQQVRLARPRYQSAGCFWFSRHGKGFKALERRPPVAALPLPGVRLCRSYLRLFVPVPVGSVFLFF